MTQPTIQTPTKAASEQRELLPECRLGEHAWCRPGEVRTSYGDLALPARRCDCRCHTD